MHATYNKAANKAGDSAEWPGAPSQYNADSAEQPVPTARPVPEPAMAASAGVNVDAGEPATSAAMTLHKAMPWEFGALLTVRDMAAFRSAYGDQVKSTDKLTLLRPTIDTLLTWAKSCLGVGRFGTGLAKSWLGWSPLRSGEVRAEGRRRTVVFYYKLGDAGCWDFCTTRPFLETSASFTMWLDIRDTDHAISPVARVRGMLSRGGVQLATNAPCFWASGT